jgi:4-amino-4-deoxy-L-arabinose transferase-like glycosyltransferase
MNPQKIQPSVERKTPSAGEAVSEKKSSLWSSPLVPVIAVVLCLLPFVNKAFHMDDPLFVWTAQQIQKHPLDFYGFSVNWYTTEMPMFEVTKNPPLVSYYIAGVASLLGFNEVSLHLSFIPIAVAAALGTFYLSRRFCTNPALATLITIFTPAFLVSSTTLMCDMMMLAFWVWALFFWMRGIETGKKTDLLFSAILVSLAIMTKYFGITLIALLCAYAIIKKPRRREWIAWFLVPLATMVLYQWLTASLYGKGLLGDVLTYATKITERPLPSFFYQGLVALAFTGGCIIPILFYSFFLWSVRMLYAGVILLLFSVVILYFSPPRCGIVLRNESYVRWDIIFTLSLMAAAGVSLLGLAWNEFYRNKSGDTLLLLCWVWGTFFFAGFVNWSINARSLLPMVPAVGILIARGMEKKTNRKRLSAFRHFAPLLPSAFITIAVTWADYSLADTARTAANVIHRDYAAAEQKIWFEGHWGFQFYMQAYGYKPVDIKTRDISAGDIIAIPTNNANAIPLKEDLVSLNKTLQLTPCRWLTTMQKDTGAGFYSHFGGPAPFLFGKIPSEVYLLYKVKSPISK